MHLRWPNRLRSEPRHAGRRSVAVQPGRDGRRRGPHRRQSESYQSKLLRREGPGMPASTHERSAQLWRRTLSDRLLRSVALPAGSRHIQSGDISALALLFFAAFQGTIDDTGQTETQYALKAKAILGGRYGEWISEASWAVEQTSGLQSACLVCDYKPYGCHSRRSHRAYK